MPERLSDYVPMTDANTKRVRTSATLPFHLENEVGLNTKRIQTLLQIGGLRSIKISSKNDGERSSASLQTVGFGKDGSALAGIGKVSVVPTYSDSLEPLEFSAESKQKYWPSLNLTLNNNELKQRMLQSDLRVSDPANWANEIDKAIKKAVRHVGTKNLLDMSKTNFGEKLFLANHLLALTAFTFSPDHDASRLVFWELMRIGLYSNLFTDIENFQRGEGYRLSILPGLELDRAIILQIATRAKLVAKDISK